MDRWSVVPVDSTVVKDTTYVQYLVSAGIVNAPRNREGDRTELPPYISWVRRKGATTYASYFSSDSLGWVGRIHMAKNKIYDCRMSLVDDDGNAVITGYNYSWQVDGGERHYFTDPDSLRMPYCAVFGLWSLEAEGQEAQRRIPGEVEIHEGRNPFTVPGVFRYWTRTEGDVQARLIDVAGRLVGTLIDERQQPGYHFLKWDGRSRNGQRVPAGMYWLRVDVNGETDVRPFVMLK
jgi:hypothetical protein